MNIIEVLKYRRMHLFSHSRYAPRYFFGINPKTSISGNIVKLCIFLVCLITLSFISVDAAFIDSGWGTRGAGKGGAFVATADDASSIMWNPGAFSQIFMREAMVSYHKPYAGLDGINMSMGYLSVVFPVYRIANFGFAVSNYSADSLYRENIFQLTAAREFFLLIPRLKPVKIGTGISLKYLMHGYKWDDELKSLGDPITGKDSAGAFTIDLGFLLQPVYEVPIGISVKNIIPADVGLVNEDIVPLEADLGAAYRMGALGIFEELVPEVKVGYRNQEYGNKINYAVGVETWLNMRTIGLRLGYNPNEIAFGTSFERYFGIIGLRIDYTAILSMVIEDNIGSHRISTSVKF